MESIAWRACFVMSLQKYSKLFVWDGDKIEDIRFWCCPDETISALNELPNFFDLGHVDGFCALEARGFLLSGIAAAIFKKPVLPIRKHKRFYDRMDHTRVDFTNWKGDPEAITFLRKSNPQVKRVLVVDDILDSGASLQAVTQLFSKEAIEIVGAYYLLDASREDLSGRFKFPIRSAVKHKLF
jgi:adenine/guanine phosphoribosyltransferase-like PRPP-binding protein